MAEQLRSAGTRPVVVIGAGIGGLSAAIRLAAAGRRVVVLEQNARVGGKMNQHAAAGFRWDTGPSVITMRHVFEELFAAAGRNLADYLTLEAVEPLTRYFYPDGTMLDATSNLPEMTRQIAALDERDVEGYLDFLAYAARLHRITGPVFIYDRPPTPASFTRVPIHEMVQVDPWFTMDQVIRKRVRSPQMRQLLGRFATYVGASPYRAPATLSVIAHVELTQGVWYPRGGIYRIAQAMAQLADEMGVEIRTEAPVRCIVEQDGSVAGVEYGEGEFLPAQAVVANVDVTTVYQHLLPSHVATPARRRKLAAVETSCSGYVMMLGVEGEHPQLAHHNIFFSRDYPAEFRQIFEQGAPPDEPTVYVAITSKSDPDHAPSGCENWFVLVNAPATGDGFDWAAQEAGYREVVFETLARFGLDIRERIRYEAQLTPEDIARLTGAWRGALYGISSNRALNAFRRPHNRCPHLSGLYFAGGTTHPGGGVPMVTLSGKVAADLLLADLPRSH